MIEQQFAATVNRVVLAGIGGVGYGITVQLALTSCKSNRSYETGSLELQSNPAMDSFIERSKTMSFGFMEAKFEPSYRKVARLLDLPGREDEEIDIFQLVRDYLAETSTDPWLMVLDNADDHDLWLKSGSSSEQSTGPLIKYLPRCTHGRLLISTRDNQLGYRLAEAKYEPINVLRLGSEEAGKLLRAEVSEGSTNIYP